MWRQTTVWGIVVGRFMPKLHAGLHDRVYSPVSRTTARATDRRCAPLVISRPSPSGRSRALRQNPMCRGSSGIVDKRDMNLARQAVRPSATCETAKCKEVAWTLHLGVDSDRLATW
jgi:hypothetical protein